MGNDEDTAFEGLQSLNQSSEGFTIKIVWKAISAGGLNNLQENNTH